MALNFGKVGVLMGGASSEREISLKSGEAVYRALADSDIDVTSIDIKTDNIQDSTRLLRSAKLNCAFVALHGRFGEDGQVQSILEKLKIPYTGSGVASSKLAMDKIASRAIFKTYGLYVPQSLVIGRSSYSRSWKYLHNLGMPLVIKPATHGSSIGLSIIRNQKDLGKALEQAFVFDRKVIAEKYIAGRELTVGILSNFALPVIEIIPKKRFFDFQAKYQPGMTRYIVPAKLDLKLAKKVKEAALLSHLLLGCSGFSRVDIILSTDNLPYILEVNTIPGLTEISLLPKAAKSVGIEFNQLCLRLIELAYEKKKV
ncbi:MAG: D-alanine--D-alanine ligase [Candidatus Omnitrophica bacterium]|nr:D-alanine--D-alanine ligase [Candidatus Omnitrophota bacterium]